jgi:hypothetical protein
LENNAMLITFEGEPHDGAEIQTHYDTPESVGSILWHYVEFATPENLGQSLTDCGFNRIPDDEWEAHAEAGTVPQDHPYTLVAVEADTFAIYVYGHPENMAAWGWDGFGDDEPTEME